MSLAPTPKTRAASAIPATAGVGLRAQHYKELISTRPNIGWIEVHSENYFGEGGAPLYYLEQARALYPLSLHGVGMSIGSTDELNLDHLNKLARLIARFEPHFVSDHLCWSSVGGDYLNDLLPLPYTPEALAHVVQRIDAIQDYLGREILIENPSTYLQFLDSEIPEAEFLTEVAKRSGCGILLDVNNVYVSATNHGIDAEQYLTAIPATMVREIHLAGFTVNRYPEGDILIDTHSAPVVDAVWSLYRTAISHLGPRPTLIEWDTDIPALAVLVEEAAKAQIILGEASVRAA